MTEQDQLQRPPAATPKLYAQDGKGYGATVHAHYFLGASDWLVTEYDPDDDLAFGWACLNGDRQNAELGYTSLAELGAVSIPVTAHGPVTFQLQVGIAYEEDWTPCTLTEAIERLDHRMGLT